MIRTCWELSKLPEFADLKLWKWAHMLGFRGHFSTKSRSYSTTLGALRAAAAPGTPNRRTPTPACPSPTWTPRSSSATGPTSAPATAPAPHSSPPTSGAAENSNASS
ncbi:hypothetical protein GA0115244_104147 [Streptomyces sp. DvalAA-19]|nr:hypothetical protein GA0115244_104147 [Streptomyces sp. DvalAA-19]